MVEFDFSNMIFQISSTVEYGVRKDQLDFPTQGNQIPMLLPTFYSDLCPVFLVIKNRINRHRLHQFLGTKTTKALKMDANEAHY